MTTVTIQIGNTDNKITQQEYAGFIHKIDRSLEINGVRLHFRGGSSPDLPWQNFCWVFQLAEDIREDGSLYRRLHDIRKEFKQDSLAWTEGKTLFI